MSEQALPRMTGINVPRKACPMAQYGLLRPAVPLLGAMLVCGLAGLLYSAPPGTFGFGNRIADLRLHADAWAHTPLAEPHNDALALITIDEESIGDTRAGLGAWPFPRKVYGELLSRLTKAGARAVAFDIDFLEPSADPSQDAAFAASARKVPAIIGYTVTTTSAGIPGAELPPSRLQRAMSIGFTSVASPAGFVIGEPLQIGPMPTGFPGGIAHSLALETVDRYLGTSLDPNAIPAFHGEMLVLPFSTIGTVDTSQRAGAERVRAGFVAQTLSFADALTMSPAQLRPFAENRIVLVGATAQALQDFAPTISGLVPGVYVHARLIDQLLRHAYVRPAPPWLDITLIVLLPIALVLLLSHVRAGMAMLLSAYAIASYVVFALALFVYGFFWLNVVHVAGAMVFAALVAIAYRTIVEAAQRKAVTEMFGKHVSPAVVKEILKAGDAYGELAGKRAKVTIFYSDIRGFTAMSERMQPEEIYEQLNEYFEAMCQVIFAHGGYIDKFIGDCIMAVFSAPHQTAGDARKAVESALDQQEIIAELSKRWHDRGKIPFTVGMGINTGYVVMGNLGAQKRMNYTVIGDEVNVAARLYNIAAGGQIIVSESTYEEVREHFEFRELERVAVKGKAMPLRAFEVLGRTGAEVPPTLEMAQ